MGEGWWMFEFRGVGGVVIGHLGRVVQAENN